MIAEKIKWLREQKEMTQTALAKQLGITRSSVNAWELGISVPSTQYVVELAHVFHVSTDYLLGFGDRPVLHVDGLNEEDIRLLYLMAEHLKQKNRA